MTNRKQLVLLNAVAILSFILCWIWLGFELSEEAMFSSNDSGSYLDVAKWILQGEETLATSIRPIFYPILIGIPYLIFGATGIWVLQFACWLITVNLTFLSAKKWSNNPRVGWLATIGIILNLSFIALTFHALTEVVTTALLAVLFYHVVSYSKKYDEVKFGVKLLLIFVALTLVKPAFFYPTIFCFILVLFGYRKSYRVTPKKLIFPLLIIIPILLQMTIVQVRHGSFTVSKIAGVTFEHYYYAQCVRNIEGIEDNQESIAFVDEMSSGERKDYILEHKGVFVAQFAENVILNLKSDPVFLDGEYVDKSDLAFNYMRYYNVFALLVNVLGIALLSILFLRAFFKRDKEVWIPLLCIGGLSSYFLFTTGLSFWQGDRLVLPAIALWMPLFAVLFYRSGTDLLRRIRK